MTRSEFIDKVLEIVDSVKDPEELKMFSAVGQRPGCIVQRMYGRVDYLSSLRDDVQCFLKYDDIEDFILGVTKANDQFVDLMIDHQEMRSRIERLRYE